MNTETQELLKNYAHEVTNLYKTGVTTEHSFRGSLQTLLNSLLPQYNAVNEPQRSACGAPDYALVGKKDRQPHAYIEAKDLFDNDLRGTVAKGHKEQFDRYKQALSRVAFTDYLTFVFFVDSNQVSEVTLLKLNSKGAFEVAQGDLFVELLTQWADCSIQPITSASRLAKIMAYKARLLRDAIEKSLENDAQSEIRGQYEAFKSVLLSDLTPSSFADLYAQTIAYGMFAARLHDTTPDDFSRQEAATLIPLSNPFLRKIFQSIAGYDLDDSIAWIVDDLVEAFVMTDIEKIMGRYQQNALHQDPLIHFYEDFLAAYDPSLRKSCGVYYTPQPVVSFIVRAVDEVLKRDFGLADGLADDSKVIHKVIEPQSGKMVEKELHRVQILDPATGTGTFLAQTVRQVYQLFEGNDGMWQQYVEESLRPRLHGFELLMAPYTITHLKLDMMLNSGVASKNRLRVYLTNSLEQCHPYTGTLFAQWLSNESAEANAIKRDCPVMVMMGNPPYSGESQNKGKWIMDLMEDYKKEPGGKVKLNERNPKWINDDYVKFIRLAQHYIERNEQGVIAYINPHGFLDNPTFRGMRWNLLYAFDKIYSINLHGNSKKKEVCPDGSPDENVFDIMQGVSINLFVKTGKKGKNKLGKVYYADLYGKREEKNAFLDSHSLYGANTVDFQELQPKEPMYFFVPKDMGLEEEYNRGLSVVELFKENNVGIVTGRDASFINFSIDELKESAAVIDRDFNEQYIKTILYRPLDTRQVYYKPEILARSRARFMQHMIKGENIALATTRENRQLSLGYFSIVGTIADIHCLDNYPTYLFPLYLYDENGERSYNINCELIGGRKAEEFFAYIYAVLHSPSYRERYKEFLKIDFPRIPLPTDEVEYQRLVALGQQLIDLHLLRANLPISELPKYPIAGNHLVEGVKYEEGKVWINKTQYFDGVSQTAWSFFIGGYQPAQKWLKDRKNRTLNLTDIRHYQRLIATLDQTAEIMGKIG